MNDTITDEMKAEIRLQDRPTLLERVRLEAQNPYFVGKSNSEIVDLINSGWKVVTTKEVKSLQPKLDVDGFQMTNETTGALIWDKVVTPSESIEYIDAPIFRIVAGMKHSFNLITEEDLLEAIQ